MPFNAFYIQNYAVIRNWDHQYLSCNVIRFSMTYKVYTMLAMIIRHTYYVAFKWCNSLQIMYIYTVLLGTVIKLCGIVLHRLDKTFRYYCGKDIMPSITKPCKFCAVISLCCCVIMIQVFVTRKLVSLN